MFDDSLSETQTFRQGPIGRKLGKCLPLTMVGFIPESKGLPVSPSLVPRR